MADEIIGGMGPLLFARREALESSLSTETVLAIVVHQPIFHPEQAVRHPSTPLDVLDCNIPEPSGQLGLFDYNNLNGISLSAAASFLAQTFPSATSCGFAGPAARASPSPGQPRPDAFWAGVLPVLLSQMLGLLGLHASVPLLSAIVGSLRVLDGMTDVSNGLSLRNHLLSSFKLSDDLPGCVIRFMVKSPTKSGRLRILIHRGLTSGGHIIPAHTQGLAGIRGCLLLRRVD
jgi:hypothetical protein